MCLKKRPEINNLIIKIKFYDNNSDGIIRFCKIVVGLNLIISFIDNKKLQKRNIFSTTLHEECVGQSFYSYERKDNQSLSEDIQNNFMHMVKALSQTIN